MGLNLVVGCHEHRERIWFFRGKLDGLEAFYRAHWRCHGKDLSDDQSTSGEQMMEDYPDVGEQFGAWRPDGIRVE
jgi:hypothetical protein